MYLTKDSYPEYKELQKDDKQPNFKNQAEWAEYLNGHIPQKKTYEWPIRLCCDVVVFC